jgi:hypothetical protein
MEREFSGAASAVVLTQHAKLRMRQRGVKLEILRTLMSLSDRAVCVGRGCVALTISRDGLAELKADGVPPAILDAVRRNTVVVGDDGSVLTVAKHFDGRKGRSYRRGRN